MASDKDYDYVVMWHSGLTDATAKKTLSSMLSNASNYVNKYVIFNNIPTSSGDANITMQVMGNVSTKNETYTSPCKFPEATRDGYALTGWKCSLDNKIYQSYPGFYSSQDVTFTAVWKFEGKLIGEFEGNSWVVKGKSISLLTTYMGDSQGTIAWKSETPNIATVNQVGVVKGVSEGLATIVVYDSTYPDISFTFYVTVLNTEPTGLLKLLVDSNNSSIYTKNDLIIGIANSSPAPYYTDIIGSVSKLLFTDYVVHNDFYLSNPSNKSTLNGDGKNGIDFITVHYAADMPYSANYSLRGGYNLASMNKTYNSNGTQASWHYSVGNDGVWACQSEAYGAWHAGSSKKMTWTKTTVKYTSGDPEIARVTLGSDGYFYINGKPYEIASDVYSDAFNQYFSGGFSGIVLNEIRTKRSMAYTAYGVNQTPSITGKNTSFIGYVGTQSDKVVEAINVYMDLLTIMPADTTRMEAIRAALKQAAQTAKPSMRGKASTFEHWKRLGYNDDPAKINAEKINKLTYEEIEAFYKENIQGKPVTIILMGDPKKIDLKAIQAKMGCKVTKLSPARLFNSVDELYDAIM